MTNPYDFRASQIRTHQIITSGSTGTNASLLIYDFAVASDLLGGITASLFNTGSIGTDTYMYVSGVMNGLQTANNGVSVFGGDVYFSGNIGFPSGVLSLPYAPGADAAGSFPLVWFRLSSSDPSELAIAEAVSFEVDAAPGITRTDDVGQDGGGIYFICGNGGDSVNGNGGGAGTTELAGGQGGSSTTTNGGAGGGNYIFGGTGGNSSGTGSSNGNAGTGGPLYFFAGNGGGNAVDGGVQGTTGGIGGQVNLGAGSGGGGIYGIAGQGGPLFAGAGDGGFAAGTVSSSAGKGGDAVFYAGNAGATFNTHGSGSGSAVGGDLYLHAGAGSTDGISYVQKGGNVFIAAGSGTQNGTIFLGNIDSTGRVTVFHSLTTTGSFGTDAIFAVSGANGSDAGDYLGEGYGYGTPVSVSLHSGHVMVSGSMHVRQGFLLGSDWFDYVPQIVALASGASANTLNVLSVQKVGYNSDKYRLEWGEFGGATGLPEGTYHRFLASTSSFYQSDAHGELNYNGFGPHPSYQFDVLVPQGAYGYQQPLFKIYAGISGTSQYPVYNGDFVFGHYLANAVFVGPTSSVPPTVLRGDDVISGTNMQGVSVILRSGLGSGTGSGSFVAVQAGRRLLTSGTGSHTIKDIGIFWHDGRFQIPGDVSSSLPTATTSGTGSFYFATDTSQLWFQKDSTTYVDLLKGSAATVNGRLFVGSYTTTTNTSSNPQVCGQNNWTPTDYGFVSGSSQVFLKAILSALTGSATAFVRLYNVTSGAYVHIGGAGVTELSTSLTTPTKLTSVNLANATNFSVTTEKIYEVQIYTSTTASTTFLGSAELLTQV